MQKWETINNSDIKQEDQTPMLPFLDLDIVVQASQTIAAEVGQDTVNIFIFSNTTTDGYEHPHS